MEDGRQPVRVRHIILVGVSSGLLDENAWTWFGFGHDCYVETVYSYADEFSIEERKHTDTEDEESVK
jgi:hypothetical protein